MLGSLRYLNVLFVVVVFFAKKQTVFIMLLSKFVYIITLSSVYLLTLADKL